MRSPKDGGLRGLVEAYAEAGPPTAPEATSASEADAAEAGPTGEREGGEEGVAGLSSDSTGMSSSRDRASIRASVSSRSARGKRERPRATGIPPEISFHFHAARAPEPGSG